MANAPTKTRITVSALSKRKLARRRAAIVKQSTVRAQLPAICMTMKDFALPEKRCAGNQKNTRMKTTKIQHALSAPRAAIRKAHEIE
jgi:hypothetical protein